MNNNPMHCGAKTRSGAPCKSYGMKNGRCRMHGGTNPGPPKGNRNALKHGFYSKEEKGYLAEIELLIRQ